MSVISEEPAADAAQRHAPPAANAADHPNPGAAQLDERPNPPSTVTHTTDPAPPSGEQQHPKLPDNASHATSLPDEAQVHAARTDSGAGAGADPFLDTEQTPALPPRPEAAEDTAMVTAPAVEQTAHEDVNAGANAAAREEQVSPQVASLRAMFPDFDVAVLQSVLDSVDGDQERALDILLGMSDPEYVSTHTAPQPEQSSLDLDEQLARQLMLEDQQQQQRQATGNSWPRRDQADVPYQTRQPPEGHLRPPPSEGAGKTDLQELSRTMGQIAESGKRTFSSIVSKVKAKINEYEASRAVGQSSTGSSASPQWGAAPPTQLDRHTASQAYRQQYYPEPSPVAEQPISLNGPSTHGAQAQGYNVDAPPAQRSAGSTAASPMPTPGSGPTTPPPGGQFSPAASPRPSGDIPRPPPTGSGSPVNPAKIGLLPKRPVSLLNVNTPPATKPSDEDDDLEYVENPFEERK